MTEGFDFLQQWFLAHCDEDWEHDQGVLIESLDNPGWSLKVGLLGTELQGTRMEMRVLRPDQADWVTSWSDGEAFEAACGPLALGAAIEEFRRFVKLHGTDVPASEQSDAIEPMTYLNKDR